MTYRWQTGSIAWFIHRASGVILTLYIFVHLYVLSHLADPEEYTALLGLLENPLVRLSEIGLLALVISHALNGIRLTIMDFGAPTKVHKTLFIIALIAGGILFLLGAWPIIRGTH